MKLIFFFIIPNLILIFFKKIILSLINNGNPIQQIIFLKSNKILKIYKINTNEIVLEDNIEKNIFIFKNNTNDIDFTKSKNYKHTNLFNFIKKKIFNKKLINLHPGGFYGFYDVGTCTILKHNFNMNNFIYNGASAGAWNSLFMVYKYDINGLIKNIFTIDFNNTNNLKKIQLKLKEKLLSIYKNEDFELDKIFIGVSVFENFSFKNYIYTDFRNLEEVIDCCMSSSNIPFVTGNLLNKFNNKYTFDGGICNYPFIYFTKPFININNNMWGQHKSLIYAFYKQNEYNLFESGKIDSQKNLEFLKKYFSNNKLL